MLTDFVRNAWRTIRDGPVIGNAPLRERGDWVTVGDYMLRKETVRQRDVFGFNSYDQINRLFVSTTFYQNPDGTYQLRQQRDKVYFPRKN